MLITEATKDDLKGIYDLQKLAYLEQAQIYNDYTIQPLQQSYEELVQECGNKIVLKATEHNRIIGSVRAYKEGDTCYFGKLMVHPDCQNNGIGKTLMNAIEDIFKDAKRFELFTGHKSKKNLHLYNVLGYKELKRERSSDTVVLVFLEKINRDS